MLRNTVAVNIIRIAKHHRIRKSSTWREVQIPVPWGHVSGKWWGPLDQRPILATHGCRRRYSTDWEEIRIPLPWGHVAAKWWGPHDKQPILTSHGWQDNCGTHDLLIPKLPKDFSFLTYDFPGHGLSTKLPPGIFYHSVDGAILIRQIMEHFSWRRVALMGHSLGAAVNSFYALSFPETVDFLVSFDSLKPQVADDSVERKRKGIDTFLKYDHINGISRDPPSFTYGELEGKLHEGTRKQIALERCRHVLDRNVLPAVEDGKFYFTRDLRLKTYNVQNWSQEDVLAYLPRMNFPIYLHMCSGTPKFEQKRYHAEAIELLKRTNPRFEVHYLEGTHHVHLNNPERVAGPLTEFLLRYGGGGSGGAS